MKLVSAIMPTRGRNAFALQAVQSFIGQTYENRELVIIDDMNDRSFPQGVLDLPRSPVPIVYQLSESRSIAEKRNRCCELANGEFIIHFDDDDVSTPGRVANQVYRLEESGKAATGFHSMLFRVEQSGKWLKYMNDDTGYALGTSLCFRKSWWAAHPFRHGPEDGVGEDNVFVREARRDGEILSVDAASMMWARIHSTNTSEKRLDNLQYHPVDLSLVPKGFPVG